MVKLKLLAKIKSWVFRYLCLELTMTVTFYLKTDNMFFLNCKFVNKDFVCVHCLAFPFLKPRNGFC